MTQSRNSRRHGGVHVDHTKQLPRLKRAEGQVRGLQQMIEQERNCIDIAYQISAVVAALRRVQSEMLRDHLVAITEATIAGKLPEAERRHLAEEVGEIMKRFG